MGEYSGEGLYPIQAGPISGMLIYTDPQRIRTYMLRTYEPHVIRALQHFCKPGMVVGDIGAHHGHFKLIMSGLIGPTGRCYSFEAAPQNCNMINRSLDVNQVKNVVLENSVVGNKNNNVEFMLMQYASS